MKKYKKIIKTKIYKNIHSKIIKRRNERNKTRIIYLKTIAKTDKIIKKITNNKKKFNFLKYIYKINKFFFVKSCSYK